MGRDFQRKWEETIKRTHKEVLFWERFHLPQPPSSLNEQNVVSYVKDLSPYLKRGKIKPLFVLGEVLRSIFTRLFAILRSMVRVGIFVCQIIGPLFLSLTIVCWLVLGVALLCTLMLAYVSFGPHPIGPSSVPDGDDVFYLLMGFGVCLSGGFVSSVLERTAKRIQPWFKDLAEWIDCMTERYLY